MAVCDGDWFWPRGGDFGRVIVTRPVNCSMPRVLEESASGASEVVWRVQTNGFHTAIELAFDLEQEMGSECVWSMWMSENSFLDVGDAKDRELIAPQYPKVQFAPLNVSFVEVQHRYQRVGESGTVVLFPPVVFCKVDGAVRLVPASRPEPVEVHVPVYDGRYAEVIGRVTMVLPVVAVILHVGVIASRRCTA